MVDEEIMEKFRRALQPLPGRVQIVPDLTRMAGDHLHGPRQGFPSACASSTGKPRTQRTSSLMVAP